MDRCIKEIKSAYENVELESFKNYLQLLFTLFGFSYSAREGQEMDFNAYREMQERFLVKLISYK